MPRSGVRISPQSYKCMKKICKYCNRSIEFDSKAVFANHVRWCDRNPKSKKYREDASSRFKGARNHNYNKKAWNKNLTKHTSRSVKQQSDTLKQKIECGDVIPSFLG